ADIGSRRGPRKSNRVRAERAAVLDELQGRAGRTAAAAPEVAICAEYELRRPCRKVARLTIAGVAVDPGARLEAVDARLGIGNRQGQRLLLAGSISRACGGRQYRCATAGIQRCAAMTAGLVARLVPRRAGVPWIWP